MLAFLITILKLLAILLTVTTIHELGHFLASKLSGTGVEEFSIGLGPKIIQKKYKGTKYSLRWLPLGGFCSIEGEGESETKDENKSFAKKGSLTKIMILVMGVIFNFIFSLIIFIAVFLPGNVMTTKVVAYRPDSVLIDAGLIEGDTITKINGKKVSVYSQIANFEVKEGQKDVELEYIREGIVYTTTVNDAVKIEGKIGITFVTNDEGMSTNGIEMTGAGTSATEVGIKSGDIITSVNNIETSNANDVINAIKDNAEKEITVLVNRNGESKEFLVIPEAKEVFNLGIASVATDKSNIKYAFIETVENTKNIVGSYGKLFAGKVSIGNMSGIVGIGEVVSKSSGVANFFYLMAMISMAVGVANILPFPPLDGGKVVIVVIEAITRKKVSEKIEIIVSYVGLGLLVLLTIFVTYNDIIRII